MHDSIEKVTTQNQKLQRSCMWSLPPNRIFYWFGFYAIYRFFLLFLHFCLCVTLLEIDCFVAFSFIFVYFGFLWNYLIFMWILSVKTLNKLTPKRLNVRNKTTTKPSKSIAYEKKWSEKIKRPKKYITSV